MKKLFLPLVLCLSFLFAFGGCSQETTLEFADAWGSYGIGYEETLVYDVNYKDDFNKDGYNFTKHADLKGLTYSSVGEYAVETKVISKSNDMLPDAVKNSAVFSSAPTSVISVTTVLTLSTECSAEGGETHAYTETITSKSYFCNADYSFAPIYAKGEYDYNVLYYKNGLTLSNVKGSYENFYGDKNYTIVKKAIASDGAETVDEQNYEYTPRSVIDNTSLLFALRNVSYKKKSAANIPTVSPSYGTAQKIKATYLDDVNKTINLAVNNENKGEVTFLSKVVSFLINSSDQAGSAQLLYIENGATDATGKNRSLILSYVSPIAEYSAYNKIGCMEYTLKSANFNG